MKQLRCRKELGTWHYERVVDFWKEVAPFYTLYDANMNEVDDFDSYAEMRSYIESLQDTADGGTI